MNAFFSSRLVCLFSELFIWTTFHWKEKSILPYQIYWKIHIKPQNSSSPCSCDQTVYNKWNWSLHRAAVQGFLHLSSPSYAFRMVRWHYEGQFARRCIAFSMIHLSYKGEISLGFQSLLFPASQNLYEQISSGNLCRILFFLRNSCIMCYRMLNNPHYTCFAIKFLHFWHLQNLYFWITTSVICSREGGFSCCLCMLWY